jgi:hypothetical protein
VTQPKSVVKWCYVWKAAQLKKSNGVLCPLMTKFVLVFIDRPPTGTEITPSGKARNTGIPEK